MEYSPLPPDGVPWPRATPEEAGFDADRLAAAVAFAEEHETPWRQDMRAQLEAGNFEPPPDNEIIGPVSARGGPNGLLLRHGKMLASWGDTRQVDMTFSVAKSYLSILAGIAVADGLITDLDEPIGRTVDDGGFEGAHNGAITWRQMLQLTSEWEGSLFGKSEQIDRNRSLASEAAGRPAGAKGAPPSLAGARHVLGVQRRPREPAQPGAAAALRPRPARGFRGAHHAADRGLQRLALGGVPDLVRGGRRPAGAVRVRWRALG